MRVPRKPAKSGQRMGKRTTKQDGRCVSAIWVFTGANLAKSLSRQEQGQGGGKGSSLIKGKPVQHCENRQPCLWRVWNLSPPPNWAGLWLGLWWMWGSVRPAVQARAVPRALLSPSQKTAVTPPWRLVQLVGEKEPRGREPASVDSSHVSKVIRSWETTRSHLTSPLTQLASGCCLGFLSVK